MSLAERIRAYTFETVVRPALAAGHVRIVIRAGDVHAGMRLLNRVPAVCGALGTKIFEDQIGLELVERSGPPQGANTIFHFRRSGCRTSPVEAGSGERRECVSTPVRERSPGPAKGRSGAVYLVSCVSKKRTRTVAAKDLYLSDWFVKARGYVEARGGPWFILSAEHGLVAPDDPLAPYERTLNKMPVSDRRCWAERVIRQMSERVPAASHIVFLAGKRYREFLEDRLRNRGFSVEVPMEGLRIGEQLAWLGARIDAR